MISTVNFGLVGINFWEIPLTVLYVMVIGLWFARTKNRRIKAEPEYRYYLWGFYAKVAGGMAFAVVYYFYYRGGDTIAYFYSAVPLVNLAKQDPAAYIHALFADNSMENSSRFFSEATGFPYGYIYRDPLGYFMAKLISPLVLLGFKSYLVTTVLVVAVTYPSVWKLFQTLSRYYPSIRPRLAFAVLFVPSCIFWGSGIMKDSFTFAAACWFVHGIDNLLIRKVHPFGSLVGLFISGAIMVLLKPYILMTLLPACTLWAAYARVSRIRNTAMRLLALPVLFAILFFGLLVLVNNVGESFGKFSPERALHTVVITQEDLKRGQYGSNYFDIGTIQPTWSSILSKFPQATFAGMFRPQVVESRNVMMLVSGLENSFMLLLFLYILYRSRVVHFIALLRKNPLLQMCYVFAIGYAFMIGVTTPNFGALVRFKIPMVPLFVSALFITAHILDVRRAVQRRGRRFRFEDYMNGEPRQQRRSSPGLSGGKASTTH